MLLSRHFRRARDFRTSSSLVRYLHRRRRKPVEALSVMSLSSGSIPSFKERRPFHAREKDVAEIRRQQPNKIPVIIERFEGERSLPLMDRCKFLVPDHITVAELMHIIRRRLQLHPEQAFFLLVNEKSVVSNSMTMSQLYQTDRDQDGFLSSLSAIGIDNCFFTRMINAYSSTPSCGTPN
ncbi:hypothetical protein V3C99_008688 [Haemonchus contortus]